jgi:hypothetical protein
MSTVIPPSIGRGYASDVARLGTRENSATARSLRRSLLYLVLQLVGRVEDRRRDSNKEEGRHGPDKIRYQHEKKIWFLEVEGFRIVTRKNERARERRVSHQEDEWARERHVSHQEDVSH